MARTEIPLPAQPINTEATRELIAHWIEMAGTYESPFLGENPVTVSPETVEERLNRCRIIAEEFQQFTGIDSIISQLEKAG